MAEINTSSSLRVSIQHKAFCGYDGEETTVLQDIEFEVANMELVMITGPSGCGKTTLLNLIAGLDCDYRGNITLPPHNSDSLPASYMFQEPCLLPWRTVEENVSLVLQTPQQQNRVTWLLEKMKLQHAADQYPATLSLGMCRRVALARAFAVDAPLLLMDEPFSSIDELTATQLRKLLLSQLEIDARKILFVTHNLREAISLGDRLLILAHSPTTLVADLPLTHANKRTPEATEDLYKEILQKFPDILG